MFRPGERIEGIIELDKDVRDENRQSSLSVGVYGLCIWQNQE